MNRRVLTSSICPQLMIDVTHLVPCGKNAVPLVEKARQHRSRVAQRLNVRDEVRFASSLAAALLDKLSEEPVGPRADRADDPSRENPSCVIDLRSVLCAYTLFGDHLWH
jgi:hypothetical protein